MTSRRRLGSWLYRRPPAPTSWGDDDSVGPSPASHSTRSRELPTTDSDDAAFTAVDIDGPGLTSALLGDLGHSTRSRWGARGSSGWFANPLVAPLIAVVLTALLAVAQIGLADPDHVRMFAESRSGPITVVTAVIALVGIACFRRRYPVATYLASLTVLASAIVLTGLPEVTTGPMYWFVVASLALRVGGVRLVALLVLGVVWEVGISTAVVPEDDTRVELAATLNAVVVNSVCAVFGRVVAYRRQLESSNSRALNRFERTHRERVRESVENERRVMARELHDVAAFHLTGMLVQARAAEAIYDVDAVQARMLLVEAIDQGQRSLDSLRQIVGILRYGEGEQRNPQPTIASLDDLLLQFRSSFEDSTLDIDIDPACDPAEIDRGVQLTVYRIVQESFANARAHAPGGTVAARIAIDCCAVTLEVRNSVADADSVVGHGFGIAGMRERVRLFGGDFSAGREGDDWVVRARLPLTSGPVVDQSGVPPPPGFDTPAAIDAAPIDATPLDAASLDPAPIGGDPVGPAPLDADDQPQHAPDPGHDRSTQ